MSTKNSDEPATNGSKTRDLIVEFFDDGVSRVVPGLTVIALFGLGPVMEAFTRLHDAAVTLGVGIFIAAWVIGVFLEQMTYVPFALFCHWKLERNSKKEEKNQKKEIVAKASDLIGPSQKDSSWLLRTSQKLLPETEIPIDETERRHHLKRSSEKIMFRSLTAICLFSALATPTLFSTRVWQKWFSGFSWSPLFGILGAGIFLLAWRWSWLNLLPKQKPESPSES